MERPRSRGRPLVVTRSTSARRSDHSSIRKECVKNAHPELPGQRPSGRARPPRWHPDSRWTSELDDADCEQPTGDGSAHDHRSRPETPPQSQPTNARRQTVVATGVAKASTSAWHSTPSSPAPTLHRESRSGRQRHAAVRTAPR
jgi:hypothetical protein